MTITIFTSQKRFPIFKSSDCHEVISCVSLLKLQIKLSENIKNTNRNFHIADIDKSCRKYGDTKAKKNIRLLNDKFRDFTLEWKYAEYPCIVKADQTKAKLYACTAFDSNKENASIFSPGCDTSILRHRYKTICLFHDEVKTLFRQKAEPF